MVNENKPLFFGEEVATSRIIYTPSTFAKSSLIYLQEVGELTAKRSHTSKRSNLSSYLFFIVLDGTGEVEYNGMKYELKSGDCCFLDCNKPYSHSTGRTLWTLKWVHFYGSIEPIYDKYIERGGLTVYHTEQFDTFFSLLSDLYKLASSNNYIKDMLIHEKLTSLLTLLMSESWHPANAGTQNHNQNIKNVKDYLDSNYAEKITLDGLASHFFINKFYLERSFKEQYDVPVITYLLNVRITEAKKRLRFSNDTVNSVAIQCGFSDANYFIRQFKKIEGMPPGEYRNKW